MFLDVGIENVIAYSSDQLPILPSTTKSHLKWSPRPFRFEWFWTQHKQCKDIIKQTWSLPSNTINSGVPQKLKNLIPALKILE